MNSQTKHYRRLSSYSKKVNELIMYSICDCLFFDISGGLEKGLLVGG